jgi:hypothetical protein
MVQHWTQEHFDVLSSHDNTLYGLRFRVGDPLRKEWHSDLVLDLDHIVEWLRTDDSRIRFRVVPAWLVFHDVTDLRIALDFGDSGCRTAINQPSVDAITRQRVSEQKICLDRPYYRWRIAFNLPRGGELAFGASGFTQTWRAEPMLVDEQSLDASRRPTE